MRRRGQPRDYSVVPDLLEKNAYTVVRMAEAQAARIRDAKNALERAAEEFLRTGVGYVSETLAVGVESIINYNVASYLRHIAKVNNRPPVIAEEAPYVFRQGHWTRRCHSTIRLSIPIHNRMKPLAASMLLASIEAETEYEATQVRGPIGRCDSAGTWRIFFNGEEGREAFNQFVEGCHTNPVLRVVLKL